MTGYTNNNTPGTQAPSGTTGAIPVHSDPVAAQGGYLGQAQGWASRVTDNLQGQAEHLKGKFVGAQGSSSAATGQTSSPGYSPTGTGAGYGATSAGTGYNAQNLSGSTGPSSGYSNQAQPGYDTQPTGQGYAPAQAKTGSATDGTYGATAAKPSYTEQAKQWTARAADNLHGQAEYLKGKVVGTSGTGAPVAQHSGPHTGTEYSQSTSTGYGQSADVHRSGNPALHTGAAPAGAAPAKKSWTETAKQGIASGLAYTQQGLEVVKNKVGGPSPAGPGATGTTTTGHSNTNTGPAYSAGANTGYNAGANTGPGLNAGTTTGYNAGTNPNQQY